MAVEIFSQEDFERVLPFEFKKKIELGEYVYTLDLGACEIAIRSSISPSTGLSDGVGEDSIRFVLIDKKTGKSIFSDSPRVYRTKNWRDGVLDRIKMLVSCHKQAGVCQVCGSARKIVLIQKDGLNKGKYFASSGS